MQRRRRGLLDVVDALLAVHRGPDWLNGPNAVIGEHYIQLVLHLDDALEDAGSAYTVGRNARSLVERVDPTVVDAVEQIIDTAPPTAGGLLRDAWQQIYGLHPNPTTGYRDAVRAVEELACPLVLPTDNAATLGKVIAHLRQGGHKWAFALVDRDGADTVEPLVSMLDRLWTGQVSRHGGGQKSRDQTAAEAQAAVHFAATLVQLLGAGALTPPGHLVTGSLAGALVGPAHADLTNVGDDRLGRIAAGWLLGYGSPHTRRAYTRDLTGWARWCANLGRSAPRRRPRPRAR